MSERQRLGVGADLTIYAVEQLHSECSALLADGAAFELDLSEVEQVDTAGVQLVLALQLESLARQQAGADGLVTFSAPSEALRERLGRLGLDETSMKPAA